MKKVSKTLFTCDCCGKETEYETNHDYESNYDFAQEGCWEIKLGQAGYGSKLDGSEVNFDVCDNCLCEWIKTFKHKDLIYNSGSNKYYGTYDEEELDEENED